MLIGLAAVVLRRVRRRHGGRVAPATTRSARTASRRFSSAPTCSGGRLQVPRRPHRHHPGLRLAAATGVRDWWLRTLLVAAAAAPGVRRAARRVASEALSDRAEPILAIVMLAGIAAVLSTPTAAHLLDDGDPSGIVIPIWAFIVGLISGVFGYFVLGGAAPLRRRGCSARRARTGATGISSRSRRCRSRCRSCSGP